MIGLSRRLKRRFFDEQFQHSWSIYSRRIHRHPAAGDVERQAVASLRGYAYQVAAAALAWLDLDNNGKVYLEVAEDYATVAQHSLDAVQVKDTAESGSVTLNTEAVREAINAFVTLAASNKDRHVQLRYSPLHRSEPNTKHPIALRARQVYFIGGRPLQALTLARCAKF